MLESTPSKGRSWCSGLERPLYGFLFVLSFCLTQACIEAFFTKNYSVIFSLYHVIPAVCIIVLLGVLLDKYSYSYYLFVYLILGSTGLLYIWHVMLYGIPFNAESGAALLSTNPSESIEYLQAFWFRPLWGIALFVAVPFPLFRRIQTARGLDGTRERMAAALVLSLLYVPSAAPRSFRTPFEPLFTASVVNGLRIASNELKLASELSHGYLASAVAAYPDQQTIVLVIGESANRTHMHLYGYNRQTTPYTEKLDGLHVFTDVISAASTTQKSIRMMLTFANLKGSPPKTTVFDVFRKAGFKTYWLSAQFGEQAIGSGVVPVLIRRADSVWLATSQLPADERYDEFMLPKLMEIVNNSDKKKLIVVQLMGSHTAYGARIPVTWKGNLFVDTPPRLLSAGSPIVFKGNVRDIINAYDNSILYTDFVVSRMLRDVISRAKGGSAVLYLSDHGEEVFDGEPRFGHAGASKSRNTYEIPFLLRLSRPYERWLLQSGRMKLETERPYQTDSLIHTLMNLSAVDTEFYDPSKSILGPNFVAGRRSIGGSTYSEREP